MWTCLPRWRAFLGRVKEPFEWLPLKDSGKYVSSSSQACPLPDAEFGRIPLQALDEPVAHGIGGLEADAAAAGTLAQREHEDETLGIGHPGLAGQFARAENPVGGA